MHTVWTIDFAWSPRRGERLRHPIYLGEFLVFAGIMILVISPPTLAIYAMFVALQVYRLMMEERTLSEAYPAYSEYRTRTARLLLGVY